MPENVALSVLKIFHRHCATIEAMLWAPRHLLGLADSDHIFSLTFDGIFTLKKSNVVCFKELRGNVSRN